MSEPFIDPNTGEILDKPPASNVSEFSVSEISGQLKRLVEDTFGQVRIRGEIGRVARPASGHLYLDLKDERSVLAAIIWKGTASRLKHLPEEGMEVVATGKITTFPGQSKYQIIIEQLEPAGAGALMALLEERKKKLEAEGLFATERKKSLPFLPKTVGVITSPSGAVIRDILHRISDRFPLHVIVWPVRVQGETTGKEVTNAINGFNGLGAGSSLPRPDVIIIARGGGSVEDLWGFNDEALVRAAAHCDIPLVSAIGHETDWTLIDWAADLRAPTPTGAAEIVVPVKSDLQARLATLAARLNSAQARAMDNRRTALRAASRGLPAPDSLFAIQNQKLDANATRLGLGLMAAINKKTALYGKTTVRLSASLLSAPVERKRQQLGFVASSLLRALTGQIDTERLNLRRLRFRPPILQRKLREGKQKMAYASQSLNNLRKTAMENRRANLAQAGRLLQSFSHQKTLERGFALVRTPEGEVITRAHKTATNSPYSLSFIDGAIDIVRVGKKSPSPSTSSTRKKTKTEDQAKGSQGDLF